MKDKQKAEKIIKEISIAKVEFQKVAHSKDSSSISYAIVGYTGKFENSLIKKGQVSAFNNGVSVNFEGSSHKGIYAGQESPHIINLEYKYNGEVFKDSVQIFEDIKSRSWIWKGFLFHYVSGTYDTEVEIAISLDRDEKLEEKILNVELSL